MLKYLAAMVGLACLGCGPMTYTNWLNNGTGGESIKCSVTSGKTTRAQFDKTCGKAQQLQSSRGCKMYQRDDGMPLYYCFKNGVFGEIKTAGEFAGMRGEYK